MFPADTILTRKEPYPEADPAGKTDEERAGHPLACFNEVRVVGASPVQMSGALAEWQGGASAGVIIQPTSFGPTVDRPLGELQRDYIVTFQPDRTFELQTKIRVIDAHSSEAGDSPEDVFRNGSQKSIARAKGMPGEVRR